MKVRNGFVSNSSSSSFIVAFPEKIEMREQLKQFIFGDAEFYEHPYADLYKIEGYPVDEVIDVVLAQLQEPIDEFEIPNELLSGWIDEFPDFPYTGKYTDEDWKEYDRKRKQVAAKVAKDFVHNNEGSFYYLFEFGDDTTMGAALEHGDLFDALPYIHVSKHQEKS